MREDVNPELPMDLPPAGAPLTEWKATMRRDFERWLASVEEIPTPPELPTAEPPDLAGFYEQLAVLGAESRRANRRTAEAFSQWGDTLGRFEEALARLRAQVAERDTAGADNGLPRAHCLALLELLDRLQRVQTAFADTPPARWWAGDDRWRKAWETQRAAFDIVVGHLETLLQQAGVERLPTLDEPFDPAVMVAVATVPDAGLPHHTVLEELVPGYRRGEELLRPAQVKVSLNQESL